MKLSVKAEAAINSPDRFFRYQPLFTSSSSKNLIIPEAAMLSKGYYEKGNSEISCLILIFCQIKNKIYD